jgi:FOG: Ankyrin repeat
MKIKITYLFFLRLLMIAGALLALHCATARAAMAIENASPATQALFKAVHAGNRKEVKRAIRNKADLDVQCWNNGSVLCIAARAGDVKLTELLLNRGAAIDFHGDRGYNALHEAINCKQVAVAQLLLDQGADLNVLNYGDSALREAVRKGHGELVKLLLERGADIYAEDEPHFSLFQEAQKKGDEEILKLLCDAAHLEGIKKCSGDWIRLARVV